jgi:hypothetical protein
MRRRPSLVRMSFALCAALALPACGPSDTTTISGQLVESRGAALTVGRGASVAGTVEPARRITHVMAVDPESASPRRVLAPVTNDGHFKLEVSFGHPYVLVFIDASRVGTDMVVAIFKARTLDTLAPRAQGDINLGEVTTMDGTAAASVPYESLLRQLGLSPDAAAFLGAVDDLSLRYANPDIDGNGVIDVTEPGHRFQLDFHLRADMLAGPDGGALRISDITDQFAAEAGPHSAWPSFNLGSIYALYPTAFDRTSYVANDSGPAQLRNGAAFRASAADGTPLPGNNTSFSALAFGDTAGWGPDYAWATSSAVELPGSAGAPVNLAFTLGGSGHTLTFANVLTRTRASLGALNTPVPFVRLDTEGGQVRTVEYKWMKRTSATSWVPCTAEELDLVVGESGAFLGLSRGSKENRAELVIPRQPSGTIPWSAGPTAPGDICSMALSYDDKLGLRLFVGGVQPNEGVATCY